MDRDRLRVIRAQLEIEPGALELLRTACRGHSEGLTAGDITALSCRDADRLDPGRIGIEPRPERLCTAAARDPGLLEWAYRRSLR